MPNLLLRAMPSIVAATVLSAIATPAGATPHQPACADRLYALNSYSNDLSVVDTRTNQVVDTIGVGRSPAWAVFGPHNKQLYVDNNGDASISVIDVATNRVVRTIPTPNLPIGLAFTPDGTRMVVSYMTGTAQIITAATGAASPQIPVGVDPEQIRVTPDGRYAYALSSWQGMSKVDIDHQRVVATIPLAHARGSVLPYPYNLLISPDGRRVYVANTFGGFITVVDTASDTVVGTFDAPGAVGLQLSKDGAGLYVTNFWAAGVDEYSVATGRLLRTSGPTGIDLPSHLMLSHDGRYLYFGQSFDRKLLVFDTRDWKPVATLRAGVGPNSVVVCESASPR